MMGGGEGGAMPNPRQMSGEPRPEDQDPPGSLTVRLTYDDFKDAQPPAGVPVVLVGYSSDDSVKFSRVESDKDGRATFTGLDRSGGTSYFAMTLLPRGSGVERLISTPAVLDASEAARRERGYKLTTSPRGKVFDLDIIFADLNARYFDGLLERPQLSWSMRRTRRVLGHHDHVHGTITISRTLDSRRIPRFLLDYVLYHEMLHVKHPPKVEGRRTVYHSARFRADERLFDRYDEALDWLDKIAAPVRRRKSGSRRRRSF